MGLTGPDQSGLVAGSLLGFPFASPGFPAQSLIGGQWRRGAEPLPEELEPPMTEVVGGGGARAHPFSRGESSTPPMGQGREAGRRLRGAVPPLPRRS